MIEIYLQDELLKANGGFQCSRNVFEGVNHLQAITLCLISDVQGPVNSCPDKPLSALPSLQAVCVRCAALKDGERADSFKVKPFKRQKKLHECYKTKTTRGKEPWLLHVRRHGGEGDVAVCMCVLSICVSV